MPITTRAFCSRRTIPLLLLGLLALPTPAAAQDREVWITIERRALNAFEAWEGGSPTAAEPKEVGAFSREVVAAPFTEGRVEALTAFMHERYGVCGGFIAHPSLDAALAAQARAATAATAEQPAPPVEYTIDNGPVVQALLAELKEANLRSTIGSLEGFFTRYHACHSTYNSAGWIKSLWEGYAAGHKGVTVELVNHPPAETPQPSVVLTIRPGPSAGRVETGIVILGAHQDSYAGSNCTTSRSPGADDDGSGVAVLSEVIRAALALGYRPKTTVKFMAYAAEEAGLRGSDDIAQRYQDQGANVVGVVQFDMTNYKGSSGDIYLISDYTSSAQNTFLGQLVDTYLPELSRGTAACGYGCSDHASWSSRGYPASLPFESTMSEYNPYIHSRYDTLAQMGGTADHSLKFAKLAAAYMAELAKGGFTSWLAGPSDASADAGASRMGRGAAAHP